MLASHFSAMYLFSDAQSCNVVLESTEKYNVLLCVYMQTHQPGSILNVCVFLYFCLFCIFECMCSQPLRSWGSYQNTVCSPWSTGCPSIGWPGLTMLRPVSSSTSCWCGWWFTAAEPWLCLLLLRCPPCRPQPSWATPCSPSSIWLEDLSSALRICGLVRSQINTYIYICREKKRCCSVWDVYTCACFWLPSGLVALSCLLHALGFWGHAAGAVQRKQVPRQHWKHHH